MIKLLKSTVRVFLAFMIIAVYTPAVYPASLQEKIGQMIMIGFKGTSAETGWTKEITDQIRGKHLGGVLLLNRNVKSPGQLKTLTKDLQHASSIPLFIAVDQEGGKVQRLNSNKGFSSYYSPEKVAKKFTPEEAEDYYEKPAQELKYYGINYNLAPVVDINKNPDSPAIGALERSFGNKSVTVFKYAKSFIKAHKKFNILTSLKHFPGHGSAIDDSHKGLTDITKTWSAHELKPFEYLIKNNMADSIMTGHLFMKNVDKKYPATMSDQIIHEILRKKLKYSGVVITDDLQMGAIRKNYELKEIVIRSIQAGCNILLFANYFNPDKNIALQVYQIIENAVNNNTLNINLIDNSYEKIMKMKEKIKNPAATNRGALNF